MILSDDKRKEVLDKLDKLLSHIGEGAVNDNEITIANKKIKELTDTYGISLDEIKRNDKKVILIDSIKIDSLETNPKKWKGVLAFNIATFYECRCIRVGSQFHIIGFQLDAYVASKMYQRLSGLIARTSRILGRGNLTDFSYGAVISINKRLKEIEMERKKLNEITALVVVKKNFVDDEVNRIFPRLKKGAKVKYTYSDSFLKGVKYGKEVQIFDELEGGIHVQRT